MSLAAPAVCDVDRVSMSSMLGASNSCDATALESVTPAVADIQRRALHLSAASSDSHTCGGRVMPSSQGGPVQVRLRKPRESASPVDVPLMAVLAAGGTCAGCQQL